MPTSSSTVPVHRHYDVSREVDAIEEVGRLYGFDNLPRALPAHADLIGALSLEQQARRRAEDVLRDLGFDEIVTWAFVDPALADRLRLPADDRRRSAIATANPISEELSRMRTTLLGGLLDAARYNAARGAQRLALFESGRVYLAESAPDAGTAEIDPAIAVLAGSFAGRIASPAHEPHRIAAVTIGGLAPGAWVTAEGDEVEAAGFYELKGALEVLASQLGGTVGLVAGKRALPAPGPRCPDRGRRPAHRLDRRAASPCRPRLGSAGGERVRARHRAAGGRSDGR